MTATLSALVATAAVVAPTASPLSVAVNTLTIAVIPTFALLAASTATVTVPKALVAAYSEVVSFTTPVIVTVICEAMVTYGAMPCTSAPICSLMSPRVLSSCFCFPASVLASSAFMLPTFCVITLASIAARSLSVPYCSTFFWDSSKVIPTRCKVSTCPCIALPIILPILTASWLVAFSPFCCAKRLFMAGMSTSRLLLFCRKVAICCAPLNCTSSPITPNSCCAEQRFLILCICSSVAAIR